MGCLRTVILAVAVVAGSVFVVLADDRVGNDTSTWLGIALGAVVAGCLLLAWPPTKPLVRDPHRSPTAVALGAALGRTAWVVGAGICGLFFFTFVTSGNDLGFSLPLAVLLLLVILLTLLIMVGRGLTGLPVDWSPLQGREAVFTLLALTVAVVAAGYTQLLSRIAWRVFTWVPVHVFEWLLGWTGLLWLTIVLSVPLGLLWLLALNVAVVPVELLFTKLLRRDNALDDWLEDALPIRLRIASNGYSVAVKLPGLRFGYYSRSGPVVQRPLSERQVRKLRRFESPLSQTDEELLEERIAHAAIRHAFVPDWAYLNLHYRAVVGHEEVSIQTSYSVASEDTPGLYGGMTHEELVPDFAAVAALRRLRESCYEAGYGVAYTWTFTVEGDRSYHKTPGKWHGLTWTFSDDEEEPEWQVRPTGRQYAADLERFPKVPRLRQPWLTKALRRR